MLLVAAAALGWQHRGAIGARPLNWGWALWSVGVLASCALAARPLTALLGAANFLPFVALFAILSAVLQVPAQLRRLAWLLALGSVPVFSLGLGQMGAGWTTPTAWSTLWLLGWDLDAGGDPVGFMASVFTNANHLAAYALPIGLLALALALEAYREWRRHSSSGGALRLLGASAIALGNGSAVVLSQSDSALALAVLGGLAFALYLGWTRLAIWSAGALVSLAGLVTGAALAPPPLQSGLRAIAPAYWWQRVMAAFYPDRPPARLRTNQWAFAWERWLDRPWLGWGLRHFSPLYEAQTGHWLGHPHNLVLMLAMEVGAPLTLLLLALVGVAIVRAVWLLRAWPLAAPVPGAFQWHQDRLLLFGYGVAFGGCTLFSAFDVPLFDPRTNLVGWLLLAGLAGVTHRYRALLRWRP